MSAWSVQRKLFIFLTIMVLTGIVTSLVIFVLFNKPPRCDDGIQNGLELGIDCGGVCPVSCPVEPKGLIDIWTRAFPIAEGVYSAVAYIENQNEDLYVPEVQFEFEVYDGNNKRISRASEKTTIMPNGVTPVFAPRILTGKRKAETASFRFVDDPVFSRVPGPYVYKVFFDTYNGREVVLRAYYQNSCIGTYVVAPESGVSAAPAALSSFQVYDKAAEVSLSDCVSVKRSDYGPAKKTVRLGDFSLQYWHALDFEGTYDLSITDVYFEVPEYEPPRASALVRNVGDTTARKTDFVIILYDEDDNAVTASRTFEENIQPQEVRTLQYSWVQPLTPQTSLCLTGDCVKKVERAEIIPVVLEW